ncbi:DNL-type zinc finger protein [Anthophora quadrimaculata]
MFSFRQIFRQGTRLALAKEPSNFRQIPVFPRETFNVNRYERVFVRSKTNLCEAPQETKEQDVTKKVLGKLEGKMKVMFTCKKCNYRNGKIISKIAYEKGLVIIRCDGCKNNHLIADNLGWFEDLKNKNNIEKLLAARGETVRKVQNDVDGYIEVVANEEYELLEHNKRWERNLVEEEKSEVRVQYKKVGTPEEK